MNSFQPSRGRILFEVLCALAVVASMVGAWQQTQASALLTAAAAAGLYAMVRLFDIARNGPAEVEQPQRIEFEAAVPIGDAVVATVTPEPAAEIAADPVEPVAAPAPRTSAGRRKGGSRKGGGRRAKTPEAANVVELVQPAEEPAAEVPPVEPAEAEEVAFEEAHHEPDAVEEVSLDDMPHAPVVPLFEPEPFARQQRVMFGRKAR